MKYYYSFTHVLKDKSKNTCEDLETWDLRVACWKQTTRYSTQFHLTEWPFVFLQNKTKSNQNCILKSEQTIASKNPTVLYRFIAEMWGGATQQQEGFLMRPQFVHHISIIYAPLHPQPQSLHLSNARLNLALLYGVPCSPFQRFFGICNQATLNLR